MSWIETRDQLITALNTVDGIKAAKAPGSSTGSAWVRRGDRLREDHWFLGEHSIYIIVPSKPGIAVEWVDEREELLRDAIESSGIAYVTGFYNIELVMPNNTAQLALQISVRST